jgi:hypothetical protein
MKDDLIKDSAPGTTTTTKATNNDKKVIHILQKMVTLF